MARKPTTSSGGSRKTSGRSSSRGAKGRSASGPASEGSGVRLQRVLADAGLASRRACELLIQEGRVRVNGTIKRELPVMVDPHNDRIEVDGRPIPQPERLIYIMLNKPGRTVSTVRDEPGAVRRTVLDLVDHPSRARLYPVGRLDFDTTGLVLLTNDGELANRLTHPRFGVEKTYHAVVKGRLDDESVASLEQGIYLAERREGRTVGATKSSHVGLTIIRRDRERTILELTLKEGRNRQVRRMLAAVGAPVKKLERVAVGPVKLSKLAVGAWRELSAGELGALRKACSGPARATPAEAATETDAPITRRQAPKAPARAPLKPSSRLTARPPGNPSVRSRPKPDSTEESKPAPRTSPRAAPRPSPRTAPKPTARPAAKPSKPASRSSGKPTIKPTRKKASTTSSKPAPRSSARGTGSSRPGSSRPGGKKTSASSPRNGARTTPRRGRGR